MTVKPDPSVTPERLGELLDLIAVYDTDYAKRYPLVLEAVAAAARLGYTAGFGHDTNPDEDLDGFRIVAYIELPNLPEKHRQVSWHLPEHPEPWDAHTTEIKYERIASSAAALLFGQPPQVPATRPALDPPALAEFVPQPMTDYDEGNHPNWPAIVEAAEQAIGCEHVRTTYNRTRCQNYSCARCWGGQHA